MTAGPSAALPAVPARKAGFGACVRVVAREQRSERLGRREPATGEPETQAPANLSVVDARDARNEGRGVTALGEERRGRSADVVVLTVERVQRDARRIVREDLGQRRERVGTQRPVPIAESIGEHQLGRLLREDLQLIDREAPKADVVVFVGDDALDLRAARIVTGTPKTDDRLAADVRRTFAREAEHGVADFFLPLLVLDARHHGRERLGGGRNEEAVRFLELGARIDERDQLFDGPVVAEPGKAKKFINN